jgi:2-alkenal reductase
MRDRFIRVMVLTATVLLAIFVLQPYIDRALFSETTPRPVEARGELSGIERTTIDIFKRTSPSVVQVVGRQHDSARMTPEGEQVGVQTGSGFLWDAAGHVVTNNHVVKGVDEIVVRLGSGDVVNADIIGTAPNYDLGVVALHRPDHVPPPVAIGSSHDLQVGQSAFAIGNPFGLNQSLTTGVISALNRRLPTSQGREIANVIQTDAAINPGNSGGPLLDSAGRLIGVNTAIYSPSGANAGIGFAIPVDVVNRVVPQLIRTGHVPTPGIGIVSANEADAARLGAQGVVVVRTVPGSPAERADLRGIDVANQKLGDVIVGINGKPVRQLSDLTDELERVGIGSTVHLTVERDGRSMSIDTQVEDVGHAS